MADETILIDVQYDTGEAKDEVDGLTRSIEGLKVAQKQLDQELKDGKKSQVEYATESAKIKEQLKTETKARSDAIKVINATSNSYAKLQAQTNKLIAQSKTLDRSTESGERRFQALTKKINQNTEALSRMDEAQGRHNRNVGNYKSTLKGLGSSLGLVTGGVALAGAAIKKGIDITKQAIEVNREFEKTFANVLTLLDKAQKAEFEIQLKKGAVDIMANYGIEIADVNKALFDTISAGIPAGEAIQFLDKSARLAIAGESELSSVIDGATNVMGAYGDKAGSTEEILNAFFAAQVKGKTTVGLLATNIGKVASTAAAADIPLNELFGTFAGLTKFVGGTEEAATSLAATLNAIIKPSDDAAKTFKELGIETGITGIKNNGLLNTLTQVAEAYEGNNDVLAELIPNQRALKAVAGLTSESIAEIEQNVLDLNDAQASSLLVQEAFNEQMSTSQKQAEQLSGNYKRLLITIGGGESIFKKIGTGIRASLSYEITELTKKIERFRIYWGRLTGDITKEELGEELYNLEVRFSGVSSEVEGLTANVTEETEVINKNTQAVNNNYTSIDSLNAKVKELEASKKALNIQDKAGIEAKNEEIQSIKNQISYLESLGKMKEEEAIKEVDFEKQLQLDLIESDKEINALKVENEKELEQQLYDTKAEFEEAVTAKKTEEEEKRKALIDQSFDAVKDIANQTGQFLLDSNQSRLDNELAALETKQQTELLLAGDDAKKKEQIEKEYAKKKEKIERDFAKKQKKIAIANAIINGALSITKAFSQLGPIAGAIAAVLVAATTAFQISRINSQQFAKGGKVPLAKRGAKFGTFSGASHSQGGIPLVNGLTGQTVAEVEGRENFYVVNKDASAYINSLSDINQRIGGGVPLSNKSTRMADGGQADVSGQSLSINDITNEVVRRLPPVVVRVEDIKTGVQDYDDVTNVGIV